MAKGSEVIETLYGKYSKYEVVREPGGVFSSAKILYLQRRRVSAR